MIDTTLPNIARRWEELYLPISKDRNERRKIKGKIKQAFMKKCGAQEDIESITKEFGTLTT